MIRVTGAFVSLVLAAYVPASRAQQPNQKTYPTAEKAAEALFLAVQAGDEQAVSQILGGDKELFSVDDKGQDDLERQRFLEKYQQMHRLAREPEGTVLYLGAENWPFPIPLISKNGAWSFDAPAGMQEIVFRRIGENEAFAIDQCRTLARSDEGNAATSVGNQVPLHGYYFRALPAQGKPASFIAYPAEYRSSGVMTFTVDHDEVVYERDLGPRTAKIASTMTTPKPDSTWHALQMNEGSPAPKTANTSGDPGRDH
jgi:hypothetical protein